MERIIGASEFTIVEVKRRRPKPLNPVRPRGPDFRNVERGKRELADMIKDSEQRDKEKRDDTRTD